MVTDGKIYRNAKVRIVREGIVVYTGELESLKRFKDDVKEVVNGQDCGLNIKDYNDIKVGDVIEAYEEVSIQRTLSTAPAALLTSCRMMRDGLAGPFVSMNSTIPST